MKAPSLLAALVEPIHPDTKAALDGAWSELPDSLRSPRQFLGRQYVGCGATIGAMPRCDFACRGCYLGTDANRASALPLANIKEQITRLRAWLGEGGNLQLTDGEVTLRDPDELVDLVRHARAVGLVPMIMTHGETFRRDPALLSRLVREAGLSEISIHVDTTQRGRRDAPFRHAKTERELTALRDEFAELIERTRAATGRPLEAASTVTVTRDNLGEVPGIVAWFVANAGAFKMVSFQPVAPVGRTERELTAPVTMSELWEAISLGVGSDTSLTRHHGFLGHPDCSRFAQGVVVQGDSTPKFVPLWDPEDPRDVAFIDDVLDAFGGATLRLDRPQRAAVRLIGLILRHPLLVATRAPAWALRVLRRSEAAPVQLLVALLVGRQRLRYLNLVSHHFMGEAELATDKGKERLDRCAFRVPIDGELVSMCQVNSTGLREEVYAQGASRE